MQRTSRIRLEKIGRPIGENGSGGGDAGRRAYEEAGRDGHGAKEAAGLDELDAEAMEDEGVVEFGGKGVERRGWEGLLSCCLQRSLHCLKIHGWELRNRGGGLRDW